jgi:hypothetical protein
MNPVIEQMQGGTHTIISGRAEVRAWIGDFQDYPLSER